MLFILILIISNITYQSKLEKAYPGKFKISGNQLIWDNGNLQILDDGKEKTHKEMLENADIEDMFHYNYPSEYPNKSYKKDFDPGRIRNTEFFQNMYGRTKEEVEKNLVEIIWLPGIDDSKLKLTKINGVADKLKAISKELLEKKHLHKYLVNPGGTFNWRKIKDSKRMSMHSFGIAVDINVKLSAYWAWSSNSNLKLPDQKPPIEIVEIFEKYGFIWGGKWYHYDTMHFEYRPELL